MVGVIISLLLVIFTIVESITLLYLPLDERFTTRDAFLNLASVTPYQILTPGMDILPRKKEPSNIKEIQAFIVQVEFF